MEQIYFILRDIITLNGLMAMESKLSDVTGIGTLTDTCKEHGRERNKDGYDGLVHKGTGAFEYTGDWNKEQKSDLRRG